MSNLLSNAIKFFPQGEAITIKVQQQDTNIHILVRDRGQGVAPEFQDRLFQRFSQADSSDTRKLH
ncbi:ATP-binding protein [Vibrio metschnikovii]